MLNVNCIYIILNIINLSYATLLDILDSELKFHDYKKSDAILEVSNDGPVVFDSNIRFFARLITANKSYDVVHQFEWTNDVQFFHLPSKPDWNYGRTVGYLYKVFPEYFYLTEGDYNMNVKVYNYSEKSGVILEGTNKFKITQYLNSQLLLEQASEIEKPKDMYATNKSLIINVRLKDSFVYQPVAYFTCSVNRTVIKKFKTSLFSIEIDSVGVAEIEIDILLYVNSTVSESPLKKTGIIQKTLHFKDEIGELNFDAPKQLTQGDKFNATMTCYGSSPFQAEAELYYPNGTKYNETWINNSEQHCSLFIENITMDAIGNYTFRIIVNNEISKETVIHRILVAEEIPSALVPMFCILLVFILTSSMMIALICNRALHKPNEGETADFNFHSSSLTLPESMKARENSFMVRTLQYVAAHLQDIVNVIQQNSRTYDVSEESNPLITEDELDLDTTDQSLSADKDNNSNSTLQSPLVELL